MLLLFAVASCTLSVEPARTRLLRGRSMRSKAAPADVHTSSVEAFSEENQGWSTESSLLLPRKDCSAHLLMAAKA